MAFQVAPAMAPLPPWKPTGVANWGENNGGRVQRQGRKGRLVTLSEFFYKKRFKKNIFRLG